MRPETSAPHTHTADMCRIDGTHTHTHTHTRWKRASAPAPCATHHHYHMVLCAVPQLHTRVDSLVHQVNVVVVIKTVLAVGGHMGGVSRDQALLLTYRGKVRCGGHPAPAETTSIWGGRSYGQSVTQKHHYGNGNGNVGARARTRARRPFCERPSTPPTHHPHAR